MTKKKVQRKAAKAAAKPHTKKRIQRPAKDRVKQNAESFTQTDLSKAKLTVKQQAFIAEYLANGFNATQAAIAAGYSAKTADSQASRLLKVPAVAAAVDQAKQERLDKLEITGEMILREVGKVAFANQPYMALHEEGARFEVKTKDKLRALELLGKNQKLFTEKVEHSGKVEIAWVAELSDEELEERLKARGIKVEGN